MAVVPRVIVHKRCSVGHSSDLISIIPPRHNPVSQCKTHQQTLLTSVGVLWTLPKGLAHTHWKEITSSCRHCSKFFNRHYLQEVLVDLTNCCWCVCVCVCGGGWGVHIWGIWAVKKLSRMSKQETQLTQTYGALSKCVFLSHEKLSKIRGWYIRRLITLKEPFNDRRGLL